MALTINSALAIAAKALEQVDGKLPVAVLKINIYKDFFFKNSHMF